MTHTPTHTHKICPQPEIEWDTASGSKPSGCNGDLAFDDVMFSYPARKNVTVLKVCLCGWVGGWVVLTHST